MDPSKDIESHESAFIDIDFPPESSTLAPLGKVFPDLLPYVEFKDFSSRVALEKLDDFDPRSLMQRIVPLNYIHDALRVLCSNPILIKRIVDFTIPSEPRIWINSSGIWKEIVLDSYLPILALQSGEIEMFLCESTISKHELWPAFIQKALAKCYGGYHRLLKGVYHHVLRDLTGASAKLYKLPEIKDFPEEKAELKKMIKRAFQKEYIMACNFSLDQANNHGAENISIIRNYIELDNDEIAILVAPSRTYNKQMHEFVHATLNRIKLVLDLPVKDDEYYISFTSFLETYKILCICRVNDNWRYNSVELDYFYPLNIQRHIVKAFVEVDGEYNFSVNQKDVLSFPAQKFEYSTVQMIILQLTETNTKFVGIKSANRRNNELSVVLKPGEYLVLTEQEIPEFNLQQECLGKKAYIKGSCLSLSSYGKEFVCLLSLSPEESGKYYQFLIYQNKYKFAKKVLNLPDPSKYILSRYKVNWKMDGVNNVEVAEILIIDVHGLQFYSIRNILTQRGIMIKLAFLGIDEFHEVIGPGGKPSDLQVFCMREGSFDVFYLRKIGSTDLKDLANKVKPRLKIACQGAEYLTSESNSKYKGKLTSRSPSPITPRGNKRSLSPISPRMVNQKQRTPAIRINQSNTTKFKYA